SGARSLLKSVARASSVCVSECEWAALSSVASASASAFLFGGVVIRRRQRLYQFVVERAFGALDHRQAVAALIVLDLVHDVVDEEHAPAGSLEEVLGVARVWDAGHVEALALVFDGEARLLRREVRGDTHELPSIVAVSVLDGVDEGFVQSDEEVRRVGLYHAEGGDALGDVMKHAVHQGDVARQLELYVLAHVGENLEVFDEAKLVAERLLDDGAKLFVVVGVSQVVGRAELEGFDDACLLRLFRRDNDGNEEALAFQFGDYLDAGVCGLCEV